MKELLKLFGAFFKIGMFTIGGGLAMLPLIQETVVNKYKWMEEEEMIDCIAICQSLPGVIAINVATYVGYRKSGLKGSISATLGVITPSLLIIIAAVLLLDSVGGNAYIQGTFIAVKAASCALILYAAINMGKKVLKRKLDWAIAIVAFVMIAVFGVTALWAIVLGAFVGLIPYWSRARVDACDSSQETHGGDGDEK